MDLAFGEVELRQRLTADRKACVVDAGTEAGRSL